MIIHCKYDSLIPWRELKPHPKNRNKHSADQVERLAKLIRYQGVRAPVVVSNLSGLIVKGHGTLMAMQEVLKEEKGTQVPVVYQDFEDAEQEYAFVQSDNAIAAWAELDLAGINSDIGDLGPDFDIDLLGIEGFEIDVSEHGEGDADEVPETPKNAISKVGDLFFLGNHRLLCGDSTNAEQVARLMNGEKADMVFTDPPYGIDERTERRSAGRGRLAETRDFPRVIGDKNKDVARSACALIAGLGAKISIIWGGNHFAHALPEMASWLIWDKRDGVASDDNADCEMAWVSDGKPARVFSHLWKGCIRASEKSEKKVHPTQKPVVLAAFCIKKWEPETVLDLFLGSGSTLIACEKTNRRCFGMEIDPIYCDVILTRWAKFTGKDPVREDGKKWSELNGQTT